MFGGTVCGAITMQNYAYGAAFAAWQATSGKVTAALRARIHVESNRKHFGRLSSIILIFGNLSRTLLHREFLRLAISVRKVPHSETEQRSYFGPKGVLAPTRVLLSYHLS